MMRLAQGIGEDLPGCMRWWYPHSVYFLLALDRTVCVKVDTVLHYAVPPYCSHPGILILRSLFPNACKQQQRLTALLLESFGSSIVGHVPGVFPWAMKVGTSSVICFNMLTSCPGGIYFTCTRAKHGWEKGIDVQDYSVKNSSQQDPGL